MPTPIEIPISVPGATNAKQQADQLAQAIANLDAKAKANAQTAAQAADATNKKAEAVKRAAAAARAAAAEEGHWSNKLKESESATHRGTAAARQHEAAMNKMGEAISKVSPVAGQFVKSMGSTFGAVGVAAIAVKNLVSVAMTAIQNDMSVTAQSAAKDIRAIAEARALLSDAVTARGAAGAANLEKHSDVKKGLASVGGDAAIMAAEQFAKSEGQDVGQVMSAMLKLRNSGMNQDQAMNAMGAASEGNRLGFGGFSDLAGKAAGAPGKSFTGDRTGDIQAIMAADAKDETDPNALNIEKNRHRQSEIAKNENANAIHAKKLEAWQVTANKSGMSMQEFEALTPRPAAPNQAHAPFYPSNKGPGGPVSRDEIERRRQNLARSGVGRTVMDADESRAVLSVNESIDAEEYGGASQQKKTSAAASEAQSPGLAAWSKKARELTVERDALAAEAESYNTFLGRTVGSIPAYNARASANRAQEELERHEASGQAAGILPGASATNPAFVIMVNAPPPRPQPAAGE